MKEIKFRAWNKVATFFLKWEDFIGYENDQIPIAGDDYRVFNDNEFIIEQFTGLTDKNGKEIYEGDILQDGQGAGLMLWLDSRGGWAVSTKNDGYFTPHSWGEYKLKNTAIIGNIHENPELLESKS